MRRVFGVLAAAAYLGSAFFAFQPHGGSTSIPSLVMKLIAVLLTVAGGRQAASRWEWGAIQRLAEWLRDAERAKYHVTPIPKSLAG